MEGLDPDVVDGRVRSGRCWWKGWKGRWIRTLLMEGLNTDINWKGWIRTALMEGLDPDVDAGRGLEATSSERELEGTSTRRGLEELDSGVVAGRRLEGTLDVVVDCF